jgi:uncharacterized membrane protein YkoI
MFSDGSARSAIKAVMKSMFALTAVVAAVLLTSPAQAQGWKPDLGQRLDGSQARDAVQAGKMRRLDELLPAIRDQLGGDLVKSEGVGERNGRPVYLLRWRTGDGRLVFIEVDGETGRVLG